MATPFHRKPGVSAEQIRAKRLVLLDQLNTPAHDDKLITRDYGEHDPRVVVFPVCGCGKPGVLKQLPSGKWSAACEGCGKQIRNPQLSEWSASLQWCQLNMDQMDYDELPLFGLKGLDPAQAKARLTLIYDDLLLRCQLATLDKSLNERTHDHPAPGRDYAERLFAYRDWAKLALSLVKQSATKEKYMEVSSNKRSVSAEKKSRAQLVFCVTSIVVVVTGTLLFGVNPIYAAIAGVGSGSSYRAQ